MSHLSVYGWEMRSVMISATDAPSVHTWVDESLMETSVEAVETTTVEVAGEAAVETTAVEVAGEAAVAPTMTPGTGGLAEVEDIVDY